MRTALYARVSTNDQTVDPQLDALRSYAAARRLEVVDEFIDHGVSGSKDKRPALDEMRSVSLSSTSFERESQPASRPPALT